MEPITLALVAQAAPPGGGGLMSMLPMLAIMTLIFWFLVWRPQKKEQDRHAAFIAELKAGDEVVTDSGIFGTVKRVEARYVVLEISKGNTLKVLTNKLQMSQAQALTDPVAPGQKAATPKPEVVDD